jgi:predicted membrane channel-forming protein YqfA (hemolysin III family)
MRTRMVAIWLFLVAATVFSLSLFEEFNSTEARRYVGVAVIGIAFVKVRFIGLDFMELRRAQVPLRLAFEVWLLVIAGTLMTMYSWT